MTMSITASATNRFPGMDRLPRIVHVTADHPDAIIANKTRAIQTLIGLVDDRFEQQVLSINRRGQGWRFYAPTGDLWHDRLRVEVLATGPVNTLRYRAPGRGVFHATMLERMSNWIVRRLRRDGIPDLIVGHKLTVEGIAVARAARMLDIPYALSIQGGTDAKIAGWRPDLRALLRRVYHDAAVVFPFAPWVQRYLDARLGERTGATVVMPCPTFADDIEEPVAGDGGIVSVFHLDSHRRKNAARLIAAAGDAARRKPGLTLSIVGDGGGDAIKRVRALAARHPAVTVEGALPHDWVAQRLHAASGFALPSLRETFGLVFMESLFAGTPILYPAGTAVDGYFDDAPFAIRVNARDTGSIAQGLLRLIQEETELKQALAEWQQSPGAARFRRPAIARAFGDALAQAAGA